MLGQILNLQTQAERRGARSGVAVGAVTRCGCAGGIWRIAAVSEIYHVICDLILIWANRFNPQIAFRYVKIKIAFLQKIPFPDAF